MYRPWKCQFVFKQIYKFVQGHSQVHSAYWTDHCPRPTLLLWRFKLLPWEDISFLYVWLYVELYPCALVSELITLFYALLSSCLNMVKNDYTHSVSLPLQYFPGSTINSLKLMILAVCFACHLQCRQSMSQQWAWGNGKSIIFYFQQHWLHIMPKIEMECLLAEGLCVTVWHSLLVWAVWLIVMEAF